MYRQYHNKLKSNILTIFAGECYVSSEKEIISTVLGSCIAVCIYDRKTGAGGMNHFMLPDDGNPKLHLEGGKLMDNELTQHSMRYGITSIEVLISEMIKKGSKRKDLSAKIFGGGRIFSNNSKYDSVGEKNIKFTRAFLNMEGIPILKENVGDSCGRKIFYLTNYNSVFVKIVGSETIMDGERKYMKKISDSKNEKTDFTLF